MIIRASPNTRNFKKHLALFASKQWMTVTAFFYILTSLGPMAYQYPFSWPNWNISLRLLSISFWYPLPMLIWRAFATDKTKQTFEMSKLHFRLLTRHVSKSSLMSVFFPLRQPLDLASALTLESDWPILWNNKLNDDSFIVILLYIQSQIMKENMHLLSMRSCFIIILKDGNLFKVMYHIKMSITYTNLNIHFKVLCLGQFIVHNNDRVPHY